MERWLLLFYHLLKISSFYGVRNRADLRSLRTTTSSTGHGRTLPWFPRRFPPPSFSLDFPARRRAYALPLPVARGLASAGCRGRWVRSGVGRGGEGRRCRGRARWRAVVPILKAESGPGASPPRPSRSRERSWGGGCGAGCPLGPGRGQLCGDTSLPSLGFPRQGLQWQKERGSLGQGAR